MPSVSATAVQPPLQVQAREETISAPGAAPFILPPKRPLAAVMPATWVPCAPSTTPMLTKSSFLPIQSPPYGSIGTSLRISTTNGIASAIAVLGSSAPKYRNSWSSPYGAIGLSFVKSPSSPRSTRTVPAAASYSSAQESVVSPSRFRSPCISPPSVAFSLKRLTE